jgi:hypothetical protein
MADPMRGAFVLVFIVACGGASGDAKDPSGGKGTGGGNKQDDSIADIASREGIASLGGDTGGGVAPGGAPGTLRMELVEKDSPVKLDGLTKEWPSHVPAKIGKAPGVQFACGIQYDADKIYVMGEVAQSSFVVGKDHATLTIAFPGASGSTANIDFFPGKPGESVGSVKLHGVDVGGSKIVEAPAKDGYSFEASFPWSALPDARNVRVGLRGNCTYHDSSGGTLSTSAGLAALPTSPELSLYENLLGPNGLGAPKLEIYADLTGDAQKERIAVHDRYLTIVGAGYRGGKEYFYRNMGADLVKLDARDLTGDGKDDLVVRRKYSAGASEREWVEVWTFKSDEPETAFSHEVSVASSGKHVTNNLRIGAKEIEVGYDKAEGWDATSYREPTTSDFEPVILPWGAVKSQTYKWDGTKFAKLKEVAQTPVAPPPPVSTQSMIVKQIEPPTPTVTKNTNLKEATFEQYKKDQKVSPDTKPKVDFETNVDSEGKNERIVLIGRDIVIFGPAFKAGATYAFVTLSQFAHEGDIKEMNARDLTGDGAADLIVRGVRKVKNGNEEVTLDMMFVYQVQNGNITRVFGIETGREMAGKRIQGLAQLVPAKGGKGFDIVASPGKATGWTEKDYPWAQEQPGSGSVEPLLLPWGKIPSVRYSWSGTSFARSP